MIQRQTECADVSLNAFESEVPVTDNLPGTACLDGPNVVNPAHLELHAGYSKLKDLFVSFRPGMPSSRDTSAT